MEEVDRYFLPVNRRLDNLSAEEKLSIELAELDGANQEYYSGLLSYLSTPTNDLLALLLELTKKQQLPYDPEKDPDELDLLLRASDLYIDTGSFYDVKKTNAHIRGDLYKVGSELTENNTEDLRTANTFVGSKDFKFMKKEARYFLILIVRQEWEKCKPHLQRCRQILEKCEGATEEAKRNHAVRVIANSLIIPSLGVAALLDHNDAPYAPNIVHLHLGARMCKLGPGGTLDVRGGNMQSQAANMTLKLFRTHACSYMYRYAIWKKLTHAESLKLNLRLVRLVQGSDSTAALTQRIRDGKNIEARTPKKLQKAIDPVTGEVRIGSTSIYRADYTKAIPKLLEILDPALATLFPAQDAVKKVFDTNNCLVLDTVGSATAIIMEQSDGTQERLLLSTIVPTFTGDDIGK